MSTKKKSIIMFVLAIVLIIMGVGYAAARTALSINGTANLEATWDVSITGITEGVAKGKAYNKETPSYTGTNATFNVGFKSLGDSMDYEVTITNNGTMDAIVNYYHIHSEISNHKYISNVSYVTSGIKKGDIIKIGENKKFHIVLDYPESVDIPEEEMQIRYNVSIHLEPYGNQSYVQEYYENDRVVLDDNSIWRVLKSSSEKDENVTLIKETGIKNLSSIDSTYNVNAIQNYLNSDFKESLSENTQSKLVGDIQIPKFTDFSFLDSNGQLSILEGTLSDFLYKTTTRCYDTSQVANTRNCNLDWLDVNGNYSTRNDEVIFMPFSLYTINDGEYIKDCSNSMDVGSNINGNFTLNSQYPVVSFVMRITNISDSSNRNVIHMPYNSIIKENEKPKRVDLTSCFIGDIIPDENTAILHPVITINKDAIK